MTQADSKPTVLQLTKKTPSPSATPTPEPEVQDPPAVAVTLAPPADTSKPANIELSFLNPKQPVQRKISRFEVTKVTVKDDNDDPKKTAEDEDQV